MSRVLGGYDGYVGCCFCFGLANGPPVVTLPFNCRGEKKRVPRPTPAATHPNAANLEQLPVSRGEKKKKKAGKSGQDQTAKTATAAGRIADRLFSPRAAAAAAASRCRSHPADRVAASLPSPSSLPPYDAGNGSDPALGRPSLDLRSTTVERGLPCLALDWQQHLARRCLLSPPFSSRTSSPRASTATTRLRAPHSTSLDSLPLR